MMTDEMTCRICGGDLASNRHPALKMHQSLSTCVKILRARAEAAEAELAGLRERHENAMARLKALIIPAAVKPPDRAN